jgi:hypothetical protein
MRTMISFAIATLLVVGAIATWSVATQGSPAPAELSRLDIMELHTATNVQALPVESYDAI